MISVTKVNILDLGINNLSSISKAFRLQSKCDLKIVQNSTEWEACDLIVLPGVGSFQAAMSSITERGFLDLLRDQHERGTYIAGICLGMQLLTDSSEESPGADGLGFLSGSVRRIPEAAGERVPHMGWNNVNCADNEEFFKESNGRDFYFVHSYALLGTHEFTLATTNLGNMEFTSAVHQDNVIGFQFHPEKSSGAGSSLLKDLMLWANA